MKVCQFTRDIPLQRFTKLHTENITISILFLIVVSRFVKLSCKLTSYGKISVEYFGLDTHESLEERIKIHLAMSCISLLYYLYVAQKMH